MDTVTNIITEHSIVLLPVGLILIWIGCFIVWDKLIMPKRQERGKATARFNNILGRTLSFAFKEDKEPKYSYNEHGEQTGLKYPKLTKHFNPRSFYILGYLASAIIGWFDPQAAIYFFVATSLVILIRANKMFTKRNKQMMLLFEVAAAKLRYPREANLNPWGYVQVSWKGADQPEQVVVKVPATFASSEARSRDDFERHFNDKITNANTWIYDWQGHEGRVIVKPVALIPSLAPYPGSFNSEWNKIPLGVSTEGEVFWDVSVAPMSLITGTTGGGKSTIQRNIIFHCIQHPENWEFMGIDVKRVELSAFTDYKPVVRGIATDVAEGVEILRYANEEMMDRYTRMEANRVNHFQDLEGEHLKALMIMIDESFMFLSPSGIKTDEGKEIDALKGEASKLAGDIARLGRAAGVHLVMATQRPDATVIYGELKQNLACRVAAGRADGTASLMTLDNDEATRLPPIKGRGYIQINGDGMPFQGYFAPPKWIDKYLNGDTKWINAWARTAKDLDKAAPDEAVQEEAPSKKGKKSSKAKKSKESKATDTKNINDTVEDSATNSKPKKKKGGLLGKINDFNAKHGASVTEEDGEIFEVASNDAAFDGFDGADEETFEIPSDENREDLRKIAQNLGGADGDIEYVSPMETNAPVATLFDAEDEHEFLIPQDTSYADGYTSSSTSSGGFGEGGFDSVLDDPFGLPNSSNEETTSSPQGSSQSSLGLDADINNALELPDDDFSFDFTVPDTVLPASNNEAKSPLEENTQQAPSAPESKPKETNSPSAPVSNSVPAKPSENGSAPMPTRAVPSAPRIPSAGSARPSLGTVPQMPVKPSQPLSAPQFKKPETGNKVPGSIGKLPPRPPKLG